MVDLNPIVDRIKTDQSPNQLTYRVQIGEKKYTVKVTNNGALAKDQPLEALQQTITKLLRDLGSQDGYFEQISGRTLTAKIKDKKVENINIQGLSKKERESEKWQSIIKTTQDVFNRYFPLPVRANQPSPSLEESKEEVMDDIKPVESAGFGKNIPHFTNSCYIAAAVQILRSFPTAIQALNSPLKKEAQELREDFIKRKNIQKTLKKFIHSIDSGIRDNARKDGEEFREALFADPSFEGEGRHAQLDSQDVMRVVLTAINCHVKTQGSYSFRYKRSTVSELRAPATHQSVRVTLQQKEGGVNFNQLLKDEYLPTEAIKKTKTAPFKSNRKTNRDGTPYTPERYYEKTHIVGDPPKFLPIQLTRMVHGADGRATKVNTEVTFDDFSDLSFLFKRNEEDARYSVNAFTVHAGQDPKGEGGHFITYRRNDEGQWHEYDDTKRDVPTVTDTDIKEIMKQAYTVILKKVEKDPKPAVVSIEVDEEQKE